MRKIIVLSFITLDGVMQAPGGPEEDTSGGFKYGGWTVPYFDDFAGKQMEEQMSNHSDLLLGRKTYDIFSFYWPKHEKEWLGINDVKKYVVSTTLNSSDWNNTEFFKNTDGIKKLKESDGSDIQVHGSSVLIQSLLKKDMVDELWLKIFPITLGFGKKLFQDGVIPAAFKLSESKTSPKGVIFANFKRNGEVKTGSF